MVALRASGLSDALEMLQGIRARVRDLTPVLTAEARRLDALIEQSFDRNTSPDGRAWAPREAASRWSNGRRARPRSDTRPGRDLLERTGALRASISVSASSQSIEAVAAAPYAAYQQAVRPFMPVDGTGAPMTSGPAGAWLAELPDRIAHYVVTGEVSRGS